MILSCWILFGLAFALHAAEEHATPRFSEEEVKAAILVGFARTTDWPAGTFKEGPRTLVIGLYGRDTLGDKATAGVTNSPGHGVTVQFRVVNDESEARGCNIVFFARSERKRLRETLDQLKNSPVLTVGESDDFLDQGMVRLVPVNGTLKFHVNLEPAKQVGLRIPSKVLGSALSVRGKYER